MTGLSERSMLSPATRDRWRLRIDPVATALGAWVIAGAVSLFGGAFDMFDGALARATGRATKLGDFLDSTFDRWGEAAVYAGVAVGAAVALQPVTALLATAAMGTAFMVSYTRAKAESLGYRAAVGVAPRPERVVLLGVGLIASGLTGGPAGSPWLQLALGAIFLLSTITTIQRVITVARQANSEVQD